MTKKSPRRMRSAVLIVSCLSLVVLRSGVSAGRETVATAARQPLLFLADRDYPPLSYVRDGEAHGLDVDLARALAPVLGRDVQVKVMDWAAAQQEVLLGRADGLLSMSATNRRAKLYDFTEPTVTHDFSLFVRSPGADISGLDELAGRTVGVTSGGLPRAFLTAHSGARLEVIANYEEGFVRLTAGTLDAVAADRWVAAHILERDRTAGIVSAGAPFARLSGGIAVRRGNTALATEIDDAVRALKANGTVMAIQQQWRPQEVLFVSRQRVGRLVTIASGVLLALLTGAVALWVTTIRRQNSARRLLAHALHSANDCISITDTEDHILYVNEAFLRTYEYSERELLGRHIDMVRSPGNVDTIVSGILEATKRDSWRGTLWNRSKTGRVFPIALSTSMVHDERDRIIAAVGVARDITTEQAAADALARTEARYRDVVENATDIIFTVDREGYCLSMNRAGREVTGYVATDQRGINLQQLVVPEQAEFARRQLQRVLLGERVATFELEILSRLGRRLTFELEAQAIPGEQGPAGVRGIARDITARRELESQLRQSQKMEAIGRLAGGIAHDFNNLLTVILGYAEELGTRLDPGGSEAADLEEIERAARSASSLTRQLLIFSRKSVVQLTTVDVNDIVSRLNRMLKRVVGEHIEFVVCPAAFPLWVKADVSQIEQVILNLVVNSRDAMPTGGRLSITTDRAYLDEAFVQAHQGASAGYFTRLTVADTGSGMTPEVQAQIFTPFFTTKGATVGTGLGLATVHGIVQQAGGCIAVETSAGRGTTFAIYLPEVGESVREAEVPDTAARTGLVPATILFVEDDESIRALSSRALRRLGYKVLTARHAADALETAGGHAGRIDLLLTDIVMPGIHGPALAERLQLSRSGLRVLYTSGHSDETLGLRDVLATGAALVQKPYSMDILARSVRDVLAGSRPGDDAR